MSKFTYDLLFGSDIKEEIKAKLSARQDLARGIVFGENVEYSGSVYAGGWARNIPDRGYININQQDFGNGQEVSDLSICKPTF